MYKSGYPMKKLHVDFANLTHKLSARCYFASEPGVQAKQDSVFTCGLDQKVTNDVMTRFPGWANNPELLRSIDAALEGQLSDQVNKVCYALVRCYEAMYEHAGFADKDVLHQDRKAQAQAYVKRVLALIPAPFKDDWVEKLDWKALVALDPYEVTSLAKFVYLALSDVYTKTYEEAGKQSLAAGLAATADLWLACKALAEVQVQKVQKLVVLRTAGMGFMNLTQTKGSAGPEFPAALTYRSMTGFSGWANNPELLWSINAKIVGQQVDQVAKISPVLEAIYNGMYAHVRQQVRAKDAPGDDALHRKCLECSQAYFKEFLTLIPEPFTVMWSKKLDCTALAALGPYEVMTLVCPLCEALSDVYNKTYEEAYQQSVAAGVAATLDLKLACTVRAQVQVQKLLVLSLDVKWSKVL